MRYFIEIEPDGAGYSVLLHQGNPAVGNRRPGARLGPGAAVSIRGRDHTLGELVAVLTRFDVRRLASAYDERGQLAIGQHLYQQIFGDTPYGRFTQPGDEQVELRLITADEHIARLPWPLLAYQGVFLSTCGWSVVLGRTGPLRDCGLPEHPRLLVVAPEPSGARTGAQVHLEQLEYRLSLYDHHLALDDHLRVVTTWEAFTAALPAFRPHLVYYYGHGAGDQHTSRLVFADEQQRAVEKPMADIALALRGLPEPPLLVYVNCCGGDAGGMLGAGWQFGPAVPAVITNRTVAYADAAQAQAQALLPSLLVDGLPPHLALAQLYAKLAELNLSFGDARWITPVLHGQYGTWNAQRARRYDPLEHDPHWHLKLDRVSQFGTVAFQTRQMIRERRPRSLAYVWYGLAGQGIELFHKRLQIELQDDLASQAHFHEVRPEWPADYANPERSFEDMLNEVFNVASLNDIPRSIRGLTRGASGRPILVYVRHQPVRSKEVLNPRTLRAYLQWWDKHLAALLGEHQYALLTISFEVKNPPEFRRILRDDVKLHELELAWTNFRLLDEMERIAEEDLIEFLKTHNVYLPRQHRERILAGILRETAGHYEQTIKALKQFVNRARDAPREREQSGGDSELDYDY